jgi:hypothetical protein
MQVAVTSATGRPPESQMERTFNNRSDFNEDIGQECFTEQRAIEE